MYNYRLGLDGTNDEVTVIAGNSFEEEEHAFCLSEFLEAATCPSGIIKLLCKGSYQNVTYWYYWGFFQTLSKINHIFEDFPT